MGSSDVQGSEAQAQLTDKQMETALEELGERGKIGTERNQISDRDLEEALEEWAERGKM